MLINPFLLLLGMLALAAFFTASETALAAIGKTKPLQPTKAGGRITGALERMPADPHRLFTTIRIGIHVSNVAACCLAALIAFRTGSSHALAIATGSMAVVILVFGEIIPKSLALRNPLLIARLAIGPIYWLSKLFYPFVLFLDYIPRMTERIQGPPRVTEAELMTMVEAVEEDGQIKEQEKELIHNIFEFDDTSASEIMTPRADMFVVDINAVPDLLDIFKSGFTRIPVIDGDMDHIIGILNIKDLLLSSGGTQAVDLRQIMREPYFVPEHKKLDNLLQGFKRRKQHMAIVVDEHGGVAGLITLEDALEEIVGEIIDETDVIEPTIITVAPGEWRVMGKTEIGEVNEKLQMNIPDTGEYDTFSGFVLNQTGRIPREEEEIALGEFTAVVKAREGNRIIEYKVRKRPPAESLSA